MTQQIELFYDFRSPYSYLAFTQLRQMDVVITLRPMKILKVMEKVGNVPTTITCAAKGRYARVDVRRWAQRYGVTLNPSDMRANDGDACSRAVLSAEGPEDAAAITLALYRAIWSEGKTLANAADVVAAIADAGIDTEPIAARIDRSEMAAQLDANTDEAAERGVFGSPTVFVGEAMFFGNDRLEFVREELARLEEGRMTDTAKPLALITGVGPGTGAALARRFAEGNYRVAMLARNADRLSALEREISNSIAVPCDVSDAAALERAVAQVGDPKVVVHNAVGGAFGTFEQIEAETLRRNFEINTMALFHLARLIAPAMVAAGEGAIIVTGNTSAQRGKANFAGFAPTKAAQRILAESLARDLGPKGVHVAYLVVDAVIDVPWQRERLPDAKDDFFISPASIAAEVFHLAHQPKDAWSFLTEVRPFHEPW